MFVQKVGVSSPCRLGKCKWQPHRTWESWGGVPISFQVELLSPCWFSGGDDPQIKKKTQKTFFFFRVSFLLFSINSWALFVPYLDPYQVWTCSWSTLSIYLLWEYSESNLSIDYSESNLSVDPYVQLILQYEVGGVSYPYIYPSTFLHVLLEFIHLPPSIYYWTILGVVYLSIHLCMYLLVYLSMFMGGLLRVSYLPTSQWIVK